MKEVAKITGLSKRGGRYVLRTYVPQDLHESYGRREVVTALGTSDLTTATKQAKLKTAEFVRLFDDHRRTLPQAPQMAGKSPPAPSDTLDTVDLPRVSARVSRTHCVAVTHRDSADRANLFARAAADELSFHEGKVIPLPDTDYFREVVCDGESHDSLASVLAYCWWYWHGERIATLNTAMRGGDIAEFLPVVDKMLAVEGIVCLDQAQRSVLAKTIMQAEIQALTDIRKDDDTRYQAAMQAAADQSPKAAPTPRVPDAQNPLLSVVADAWVAEKSKGAWSERRKKGCERAVALFIEVAGDKQITDYAKADVREFKEVLSSLPPNHKKPKTSLSPRDAAKKAKAEGISPMSVVNVNKLLTIVGSLFSWMLSNYDAISSNPFDGATITVRSNIRGERDPFTPTELTAIFNAPIFRGCQSELHWKSTGTLIPRESPRFWLPLLGLYTGARLNELCKLKTADIREADGVTYIDVNDDPHNDAAISHTLKTSASTRQLPVHADLAAMGFLTFVDKRRADGSERLFPDLKPDAYGKLADGFGKHFARFLKSLGIKRDKNDFHSFRHTWTDACRNSKISSDVTLALKGETMKGTLARYGNGKTDLGILAEATAQLKFKGLDLSHLYV